MTDNLADIDVISGMSQLRDAIALSVDPGIVNLTCPRTNYKPVSSKCCSVSCSTTRKKSARLVYLDGDSSLFGVAEDAGDFELCLRELPFIV